MFSELDSQTTKSQCSSSFVWFVTCSFLSKHTSSAMLLVHLPAQTRSRCNSWRGHCWRGLLGKLLLTSWKDGKKVSVSGTLPLCHLLPSTNFLDVSSMADQQHEAAGNNGRKPIRGGLGRFSKQTSEIHSYASMMDKQNTGSRGPFMFLAIPIKEVSVEYFSGYDSSLKVPKSRILFSKMVFLFTVAWEYATLQCFNSLRHTCKP